MDDELELLRSWQAGDGPAGRALFGRYFDGLYRFFWNKVDAGDIEELVQRVLLACVEGRERFRGDSTFRTYVFRVAHLQLYKHWESLRRARAGVALSEVSLADLGLSLTEIAAQRQEHRLLLAALRSVPLDAQILLELHDWESLTGSELGEVLDLPQGTVRSRLQRAKEQLRQAFAALASGQRSVETTVEQLDEWARRIRERAELENSALRRATSPAK